MKLVIFAILSFSLSFILSPLARGEDGAGSNLVVGDGAGFTTGRSRSSAIDPVTAQPGDASKQAFENLTLPKYSVELSGEIVRISVAGVENPVSGSSRTSIYLIGISLIYLIGLSRRGLFRPPSSK